MKNTLHFYRWVAVFVLLGSFAGAQAQSWTVKMPRIPLAQGTHFTVIPHEGMHTFAADTFMDVMTMGYDVIASGDTFRMDYLGPTLNWHKGDSVFITVDNQLMGMMDTTTVHWHGMHIPAMMDGGPHQIIPPMTQWNPFFKILDEAATMWYHPHLHMMTYQQVQLGLAGMIRIEDTTSALYNQLPHTYNVDDIPLVIQDKPIDWNSTLGMDTISTYMFVSDSLDSVSTPGFFPNVLLVNGIHSPIDTFPQQMVRFRILDGSQNSSFNLKIVRGVNHTDPLVPFKVIASDAGLLDSAYTMDSVLINPGERWEIVVNFDTFSIGERLTLITFASKLDSTLDGGPKPFPTPLGGLDSALLRIIVGPELGTPINSIPDYFGPLATFNDPPVHPTRVKKFWGNFPNIPNIDSIYYDFNVINDTMFLNSTEEWKLENKTNEGHPFHIHDVHFFIQEINDNRVHGIYKGPKDVVIVPAYGSVKFKTKYTDFADSLNPYMYHCHILAHEDQGMMHQWIVVDSSWTQFIGVNEPNSTIDFTLAPNPSQGFLTLGGVSREESVVELYDLRGALVRRLTLPPVTGRATLNFSDLPSGMYLMRWNTTEGMGAKRIVIQQ